ncbi:MAG TPA: 2-amino-4-hydroxy-6-hydroxymethyldihydropteridine diphosphokinase [Victivallales bacterium]|nr:2-amino-4-hydroxy-6-hydroxymethyldihydropteridine diphosphokinase [Victivallales bacterium]
MNKVALALGGNIGNMVEKFNSIKIMLEDNGFNKIILSSCYSNPASNCIPNTPDFTNAAAIGNWDKSPEKLLCLTQKLEIDSGRPSNHRSDMSRTLDIDIILFGDDIISTEKLIIPHPRAKERDFVLVPLNEIAPNWIFPDTKLTVKKTLDILAQIQTQTLVKIK